MSRMTVLPSCKLALKCRLLLASLMLSCLTAWSSRAAETAASGLAASGPATASSTTNGMTTLGMTTLGVTAYKTLTVKGVNIFYREAGPSKAPAILLLHGFSVIVPDVRYADAFARRSLSSDCSRLSRVWKLASALAA